MNNRRVMYAGLVAVFAAAVVLVLLMSPVSAQVRQPFEWIFAKRVSVERDLTVGTTATIAGNLTADAANFTGNVTTDGTFSADGTITTQDELRLIPGTAISVTSGSTIAPTTAIQELTSAGDVGAGLDTCADGQLLMLINTGAATITITDTGTIRLEGDWVGGPWDSLTVAGSGVTCVELARANN